MATPLSAATYRNALTNEGCKVVEIPGWENHNRNLRGPWGGMNGVMIHHTGSDTTNGRAYAGGFLWSGSAALPGPLCHASIDTAGNTYLVGYGRANHAGGGDQASLDAVAAENIGNRELKPTRGNANGVDGNAHFYGVEVQYSGGHAMAPAQYDATVRWAAAICRAHGWSAQSVIGHREWSSDKWDPGQCDMIKFRADVQARLNAGAKPAAPAAPARPTSGGGYAFFVRNAVDGAVYGVKPDNSRTHLTPDDYNKLGQPVWRTEYNGWVRFVRDAITGAINGIDMYGKPTHLTPTQWATVSKVGAKADLRWGAYVWFYRNPDGGIYGVDAGGKPTHLTGPVWAQCQAAGAKYTQR